MPRAKQTIEKKVEETKGLEEPIFPLVVGNFKGKLPGQEEYDKEKDVLLLGFQYGNTLLPNWAKGLKVTDDKGKEREFKIEDITPYDFLTHPDGKREGEDKEPLGVGMTSLEHGINSYSVIPPLYIWYGGTWLSDLVWDLRFDVEDLPTWLEKKVEETIPKWPTTGVPRELYNFWVTSGEGTPGNYLYRVFELPHEIAGEQQPKHPRQWAKKWDKRLSSTTTKPLGGGGYSHWGTKTETAPAVKSFSPPQGVRMRCPGCGHWYAYVDLVTHSAICGDPEKADWALMCHSDCGCSTLDEACTPKVGFPRPKKAVTSNGEVSKDGETVGVSAEGSGSGEGGGD